MGIHFFQHKEKYLVIVDGNHIMADMIMAHLRLNCLFRQFLGCLHGNFHREAAPFAFLAFQAYSSTEHRHNTLHDGQS